MGLIVVEALSTNPQFPAPAEFPFAKILRLGTAETPRMHDKGETWPRPDEAPMARALLDPVLKMADSLADSTFLDDLETT